MPRLVQVDNGGSDYWISVAIMPSADKVFGKKLSDTETSDLITQLAMDPEMGDVIPNSGGLRKARSPCKGSGKSGGLRIVYLYRDLNMPLYILAAYEKKDKGRYTERELSKMRDLKEAIVYEHAQKNWDKANTNWSA